MKQSPDWHASCWVAAVINQTLASSALKGVTAFTAVLLLFSCNRDVPRDLAPAPGEEVHDVTIHAPERLNSIPTDVKGPDGEAARVLCSTCHDTVDTGEVALAPSDLKEFHQGLTFTHGTLACANCHVAGKPLALHLATGEELPMTEAMQLCSQCHGTQRRSYDHGAHGGMNGHWDLSRGPRLRNNCVDCHDPHQPQIAPVIPAPPIRDRGKSPQSHSEKNHP